MVVLAATVSEATQLVAQLAGLVILAGAIAGVVAFLYRWYVRETVPAGLSLLLGLAGVTVYLNTSRALGQVIGGSTLPTETEVALFNIAAFALASGGAVAGRRAGDRIGTDVALRSSIDGVERDVGRLVQSVGRVIAVELPQDIDDAVGYDPVPEETKAKLAGKTFLFPRRLTVGELQNRLVSRLKADYAVGHVDIDLADDGTVEYIALGSRAAGIGPTLPPATNAVAIRADPAFAASAGDLVQVWETDPMRRVLTAELRGVAGDTVTIAIDAGDTPKVDPRTEYRLVTLPVEDRPDREFASLLRAADETFSSVTVEAGSPMHGLPVGALTVAVVAVKPEDGRPVALPDSSYVLAPGDTVSAIARPDALRRLEMAARPLDPSLVETPDGPRVTADSESDETAPVAGADSVGQTDEIVSADADSAGGTDETDDDPDHPETPTADATAGGVEEIDERAGPDSFRELKAEFESGEADWADEEADTPRADAPDSETEIDAAETGSDPEETDPDGEAGGEGVSSGDWTEVDDLDIGDDDADGIPELDESVDDDAATAGEDDDSVLGEDLSFDDSEGGLGPDDDDDLAALDVDDGGEDLGLEDVEFDEDFEPDDSGDDTTAGVESGDDESGDEDGDDDDDSANGGGGGKSFQELKEEFESGEADWEDDVPDDPGGDMRLDE